MKFSKKSVILLFFFLALASGKSRGQDSSLSPEFYKSLAQVMKKAARQVSPALVQIHTQRNQKGQSSPSSPGPLRPFQFPPAYFQRPPGPTTGLIIDSKGFVLTSHYNVFQAKKISILLSDGRSFSAHFVGADMGRDLALIKISNPPANLPSASLEVTHSPKPGQFIQILGKSKSLSHHSVSLGIISALNRRDEGSIQVDSKANFGNTGGPLVNVYGEVIGLVTQVSHNRQSSPGGQNSGVAFAVPSKIIGQILPELKKGKVIYLPPPPSLGVVIDRGAALKKPGLLIKRVLGGTPAHKANLKKGDRLVKLKGKKIYTYYQLLNVLKSIEKSQKITAHISRDGKAMTVKIPLTILPRKMIIDRQKSRKGR